MEVLVTQSIIADDYNLVVGDGDEKAMYSIHFELTLPSTSTVEEIVERANKHW